MPPTASIGSSLDSFLDAVGSFADSVASIQFVPLLLGLLAFTAYLTLRSRAFFHILRAAYPDERFAFRRIWGAYIAAYGFNGVVPARGGADVRPPATIAWGEKDRLLLPRQAGRARAAIPQARHVTLFGCGHVPTFDDPELVARTILSSATA